MFAIKYDLRCINLNRNAEPSNKNHGGVGVAGAPLRPSRPAMETAKSVANNWQTPSARKIDRKSGSEARRQNGTTEMV